MLPCYGQDLLSGGGGCFVRGRHTSWIVAMLRAHKTKRKAKKKSTQTPIFRLEAADAINDDGVVGRPAAPVRVESRRRSRQWYDDVRASALLLLSAGLIVPRHGLNCKLLSACLVLYSREQSNLKQRCAIDGRRFVDGRR
jgi:hypothetical protein